MKKQAALSLETEKCLEKYRRRTHSAVFSLKQIAQNSIYQLKATNHANSLRQSSCNSIKRESLAPIQIRLLTYQNRAVLTDDILKTTTSPPSFATTNNHVHRHRKFLKLQNNKSISVKRLKAIAGSIQSCMSGAMTNSGSWALATSIWQIVQPASKKYQKIRKS